MTAITDRTEQLAKFNVAMCELTENMLHRTLKPELGVDTRANGLAYLKTVDEILGGMVICMATLAATSSALHIIFGDDDPDPDQLFLKRLITAVEGFFNADQGQEPVPGKLEANPDGHPQKSKQSL